MTLPVTHVLGVSYSEQRQDVLSFVTKVECNQPSRKRKILSQVAKVYDPIGFATALLIGIKIGMQGLRDYELQAKWVKFFEELRGFVFTR